MKTLIQKIHIPEGQSFTCDTYRTPYFETNWHKHEEYELILIMEGTGTALIGDHVGEYKSGDIFLLASGLPHWFRKAQPHSTGAALVLHFNKIFWGDAFLELPELKSIRRLLLSDNNGIQLQKKLRTVTAETLQTLQTANGVERIHLLLKALQGISESKQYHVITKAFDSSRNNEENAAIEKIFAYSFKHFANPVTLADAASAAGMTIPTFSRFFKRNVKKSYFDFLKELRIGKACKLLRSSNASILEICYESGYNSWAHFSKQFKQVRGMAPNRYRKQFLNDQET